MISFGLGRELFAYGLGSPYSTVLPVQPTITELVGPLISSVVTSLVVETTDQQIRRKVYDKSKRTL